MQTLSRDTTPKVEEVLIDLCRQAPAWRKLQMIDDCNRFVREAALEGLRQRHPLATERELQRRLAGIWLGEELANRAYGPARDD